MPATRITLHHAKDLQAAFHHWVKIPALILVHFDPLHQIPELDI
jgi:hypothetical protein